MPEVVPFIAGLILAVVGAVVAVAKLGPERLKITVDTADKAVVISGKLLDRMQTQLDRAETEIKQLRERQDEYEAERRDLRERLDAAEERADAAEGRAYGAEERAKAAEAKSETLTARVKHLEEELAELRGGTPPVESGPNDEGSSA